MKLAPLATFAVAATLTLAGCSSESQFPNPTGKGTWRGINAVDDSPTVFFRIEESSPEGLDFRDATVPTTVDGNRIDDFEYNFNFDIILPEADEPTRAATVTRQIEANQDFTFVLTGNISNPSTLTWTSPERVFAEGEEITEIRLAHLADSLGAADVYFLAEGATPLPGEQRGTFSFGEILPPFDVTPGTYVIVVTAPGDPTTVYYESIPGGFSARSSMIVALFDSTVDETSDHVARAIPKTNVGSLLTLPDAGAPSTIQFVQGSEFVGTADIYDDEALTNRIVAGLPFTGIEPPLEPAELTSTYYFTPADSTATVLFDQTVPLNRGLRYDFFAFGSGDGAAGVTYQRSRRSVGLFATLSVFSTITTEGLDPLDVYVVEPGASIEDEDEDIRTGPVTIPGIANLLAGTYDIVFAVTNDGTTTELSPRVPITVANGDVLRYVLFSTPDPNVIDVQVLP